MAITWTNTPILDSVQLPGSQSKYYVADAEARTKIEALSNATHFLGVTTTTLKDGDNTNPINIKEGQTTKSVTAVTGDIVIYKNLSNTATEFIFDGTYWQLLGDEKLEDLGDLAYKDNASGEYTPEGVVNLNLSDQTYQDYTAAADGHDLALLTYAYLDGAGAIITASEANAPTSCASGNISEFYTPYVNSDASLVNVITDVSLDVNVTSSEIFALYGGSEEPESVIVDVTPTVSSITAGTQTSVGQLPSLTASQTITASMSGETLVFSFENLGFNAGAFPTYSFNTFNAVTEVNAYGWSISSCCVVTDVSVNAYSETTSVMPDNYLSWQGNSIDTSLALQTYFHGANLSFIGSSSTITVS